MSTEENNEIKERLRKDENSQDGSDKVSGGNKSLKPIMIIGGLIMGLVVNVFMAYYVATAFIIPKFYGVPTTLVGSTGALIQTRLPAQMQVVKNIPKDDESEKPEETGNDIKEYNFKIDHFVVNPYSSNGRRFMTMDIAFVTNKKEVEKELKMKEPQIRDEIINLMSRKTIAELTNVVSKKKIKNEIIKILDRILTKGKIKEVYFTKYVLQ